MSLPAARIADMTMHGGVITMGQPTVLIGNMPAARIGDFHACPFVTVLVPHATGGIILGAFPVLVGGKPQARTLDTCLCVGPPSMVVLGSFTTLVGMAGAFVGGLGGALGGIVGLSLAGMNTKDQGSKATTLKGISKQEQDLAAKAGNSKEQIRAREKIAKRFYKQKAGMNAAEARGHMRGIDFNKPIKICPPPPAPSKQTQWQAPGARQGQYYGDAGTPPKAFGIHDKGATMGKNGWGTGPVQPKVPKEYKIPPETPYMESTAARVKDTWSVPGQKHLAEGGGTQRFIPSGAPGVVPL